MPSISIKILQNVKYFIKYFTTLSLLFVPFVGFLTLSGSHFLFIFVDCHVYPSETFSVV